MMPRSRAGAALHCRRHVHAAQHQALPRLRRRGALPVPADDNRERAICTVCGTIHYENPLNVVGTRAGVGRAGAAVPAQHRAALRPVDAAGRLHGARRDHRPRARCARPIEEAGARIELQGLFTVLNVVRVGQVHLFYRARLLDTDFDPGPETIEARLFDEAEIPWDEIAFRTVRGTLQRFFDDRRRGQFGVHCADIV